MHGLHLWIRLQGCLEAIRALRLAITGILLYFLSHSAAAVTDFPPIGNAGESHPGKFIWFDLVTDELKVARDFYGSVFGWQFRTIGKEPASYTLVENEGRNIAGMFVHKPAGAKAHSRWLALISVSDTDQVLRYVEQQGGSVLVPPATYSGRGTHVLFRDPQGAVFGVLKSASGDPADVPVDEGDFFWFDLLTRDPGKAADFYHGVGGYEAYVREIGEGFKRVVLASGGYARAGIAPLPETVKQPGWLPYILVADVAATLKKVRSAGGSVLVEPRATLLDGNLAVIADPRGGVLGIVHWIPAEQAGTKP